jgi:hypothetical protein
MELKMKDSQGSQEGCSLDLQKCVYQINSYFNMCSSGNPC